MATLHGPPLLLPQIVTPVTQNLILIGVEIAPTFGCPKIEHFGTPYPTNTIENFGSGVCCRK